MIALAGSNKFNLVKDPVRIEIERKRRVIASIKRALEDYATLEKKTDTAKKPKLDGIFNLNITKDGKFSIKQRKINKLIYLYCLNEIRNSTKDLTSKQMALMKCVQYDKENMVRAELITSIKSEMLRKHSVILMNRILNLRFADNVTDSLRRKFLKDLKTTCTKQVQLKRGEKCLVRLDWIRLHVRVNAHLNHIVSNILHAWRGYVMSQEEETHFLLQEELEEGEVVEPMSDIDQNEESDTETDTDGEDDSTDSTSFSYAE